MILYNYSLSSAAYRVRIALAVKDIAVTTVTESLRDNEHQREEFLRINPQGFVPALGLDNGSTLTQSLAIIEYLDETHPEPPLLPKEPVARARVRAFAQTIACDIHPLNNLRVLRYLEGTLGQDRVGRDRWYGHWIRAGFEAMERSLTSHAGRFSFGDAVTMADVCLVPQVFNARRFSVDIDAFPQILRIDAACRELPAFQGAAPQGQSGG